MTTDELKARFPQASPSFVRANISVEAGIPHPEQCQREEALARSDEGEAQGTGCFHCRFVLVRKKLLDVDAKYASVKDLLDCLVVGHIVPGDKEGQITLEVVQRKAAKGEPETTEIEVSRYEH